MSKVIINLDEIKGICYRGINRTVMFVGFGVNASRDQNFTDYELTADSLIKFFPDDLSTQYINDAKVYFETWIISNGLRDLTESFAVYLQKIFDACLIVEKNTRRSSRDIKKISKEVDWKGVQGKLKKLEELFGISTNKAKYFTSINKIRNCLAHRLGVVGIEDVEDGQRSLLLEWWAMDLVIRRANGEEIIWTPELQGVGVEIGDDGGELLPVFRDRAREYEIGSSIKIAPSEICEICSLFKVVTDELAVQTKKFLTECGLEET